MHRDVSVGTMTDYGP